jgi:hypothetical protein
MAQFDIHRYAGVARTKVRHLVVLNHDFIDLDGMKVVAPCYRSDDYPPPISRLNFEVDIEGVPHIIVMQELAGVGSRTLGPVTGSAAPLADAIKRALDLLFDGF